MSKYLIVVSLDHTSYIHVQHGCRFEEFELKEKKWRRETSCGHLIEFVGYAYNFLAVAVFSWFNCVPFLSSCWNNYFWISRGLWVFQFLMRHMCILLIAQHIQLWRTLFFCSAISRSQYIQLTIFLWLWIIRVPCVDFIVIAEQLHFYWCCTP